MIESDFASCCILSYERPDFLQQAIGSMVANAGHPMEVIVHDDGSRDPRVREMLLALQDSGLISTLMMNAPGHNEGVGVAINRMFRIAKGHYLLKLDQDLLFEPGWLASAVGIMAQNKINGGHYPGEFEEPLIGALGFFRYPAEPVKYEDMYIKDWGMGLTAWEEHKDFVGSAMMFEDHVWEEFAPFPERSAAFAEDIAFKNLLQRHGYAMALPKVGDLVINQGFGFGPSTVVVKDENEQLTSRDIQGGPKLIDSDHVNRRIVKP